MNLRSSSVEWARSSKTLKLSMTTMEGLNCLMCSINRLHVSSSPLVRRIRPRSMKRMFSSSNRGLKKAKGRR